ncbi:glycosyltransferase [Jeotgalibacillus sp. ET6]|uniref:TPR domain-containing glycosyltransferase n=1 Tax=Jeotgalibacillus sp. ET6 TaxID=3037260 RepID=UPI002418AC26|nr:TPR domain-containing glycosyltransferase [Jeotgalibacillus sp. ET6]MDG5473243.1 glycosyltransferase [Jeotgalibacillus sp. ET6]
MNNSGHPSVTLCMIVKDEASRIEKCLKSASGLAEEIVIVDTGSTDETIPICKSFGAQIHSFEWTQDFAAARNYGLSHCTGDWILWLDGDEELDSFDKEQLLQHLQTTQASVLSLPVYNYAGLSHSIDIDNVHIYYQPRLFKNHAGIVFKNRIHETLLLPPPLAASEPEPYPLTVHHYGYLEDVVHRKNKGARNLLHLQREIADPDHSPWMEYHLASEYYRQENYPEAFQCVNLSIILFLKHMRKPPSLLYKLKYAILIETGSYEGAVKGIEKAIELYSDYVDLHFYKGMAFYHLQRYKEALSSFEDCLKIGDDHPHHLVSKGAGSKKAQSWIEKCLEKSGEL